MFDVISVGSGLIDIFVQTGDDLFQRTKVKAKDVVHVPFGSKLAVKSVEISTGGGGTNTAVGFARLGLKTGFIGGLGNDNNADIILDELKRHKIKSLAKRNPHVCNGFSVILDAKAHDRTVLAYKGPCDHLSKKDLPKKINTKWFYFSSLKGKAFQTQVYLGNYAKKNGIKVMYNPSSYMVKQGVRALKPILKNTTVLILNHEEATKLIKKPIREQMKFLLKQGPKLVIITRGARGAYAACDHTLYVVHPHKVHVIESTGAGDSFASGFLGSFIKNGNLELSLQIAAKNAQNVLRHFGAKNDLLKWREALKRATRKPIRIDKRPL